MEQNKKKSSVSRREFITGTVGGIVVGSAVAGALVASKGAAGSVGTGAPAGTAQISSSMPGAAYPLKYTTDLVVVGGGMAGMAAAVSAAQEGLNVIVLEISQKTGGQAAYSGGAIHTWGIGNWSEYLSFTEGLHDPVLAHFFIDTFHNTYIPWLTSIGAYFQVNPGIPAGYFVPGTTGLTWRFGHGEAGQVGHRMFFDSLEKALAGFGGGPLLLKTRGLKLLTDKYGNLAGVRASTWVNSPKEQNQYTFDIAASSVILTTGNFQWNKEMMQRHLGQYADKFVVYGSPYQRGDGLVMAQELGAALSGSFTTFCGGFTAAVPTIQVESDPDTYEAALAAAGPTMTTLAAAMSASRPSAPGWVSVAMTSAGVSRGIIVNLDGKRFIDENSWVDNKGEGRMGQAIARQREGRALVIADKTVHDAVTTSDSAMSAITAAGGTVFQANTIQDLANAIAKAYPFYANNFANTITNYNSAIDAKTTAQLDPPRTVLDTTQEKNAGLYKISTPPFYAVLVVPAVYDSFGGLVINTSSEVLDMQSKPIPGLFASFSVAGGMMNTIYTGDIASCGTFGYIAGKSAAKYVKTGVLPTATTTTTTTST